MNVLITSASRKVGLVKSFKNALKHEGGGRVIAVDCSLFSPALILAHRYAKVPRLDSRKYLSVLIRICEKEKVGLVVPTRDEDVIYFAEKVDFFKKRGILVMVPSPETVRKCQDKLAFLSFCKKNNFGIPLTYSRAQALKKGKYPLFIKPRFGKGSKLVNELRSRADLRYWLRKIPEPIIQEKVTWPEYTVDLFSDFQGRVLSVIPRLRKYVFGGESFVSQTVESTCLLRESKRMSERLGLVGHNTLQCFQSQGRIKFIEVNPRFGGAANLGFAAGGDSCRFLVRLAKGRAVNPIIGKYRRNLVMLRFTDDVFLSLKELQQA